MEKEHYKDIEGNPLAVDIKQGERVDFPNITKGLTDTHIHIENMPGRPWRVPEVEEILRYLTQQNITEAGTIFREKQTILKLLEQIERGLIPCDIKPFYFVHEPQNIEPREIYDMMDEYLISGIKLHPIHDNYPLEYEILEETVRVAKRAGGLPILIHLDDRKEGMHLTSPERVQLLLEEIASEYTNPPPIILARTGAYAHPRLVYTPDRPNPPVESYWNSYDPNTYPRWYLIEHTLRMALRYPFVYTDTSSCVNKIKASIIAEYVNKNPVVARKIIVGSDFPVLGKHREDSFTPSNTPIAQLKSLWNQGLDERHLLQIAVNRIPPIQIP